MYMSGYKHPCKRTNGQVNLNKKVFKKSEI
jgi:hypothetical protein